MKKCVLIIEDDQAHYEQVSSILQTSGISFLPSDLPDYKSFSKLLRNFGDSKSPEILERIRQKIISYEFDFIILDRSFTSHLEDSSGLIIEEEILKKHFPRIEICYFSNYPTDINSDNYIEKEDNISWEANIYSKIVTKLIDPNQTNSFENPGFIADSTPNIDNDRKIEKKTLKERTQKPKWLERLAEKERFKLLPSITFLIDSSIKYLFYACLLVLFIYAPVFILISLFRDLNNPMLIAEKAFIVFLPFLIVCGFYVFYIKSLSPYIHQKPIDKINFERSSELLKLTKKLFISSLVSFLFINLVELVLLDDGGKDILSFNYYFKQDNPLIMLYFVIGFILILILYYIYIDRNDNNERRKSEIK
jgi:hypothetical protein